MNRPILTLVTGTPTARAESWLPPTAKIQLPTRVRMRTYVATAVNRIHHRTVTLRPTPKMWIVEEKTACADGKPSMSAIVGVAT